MSHMIQLVRITRFFEVPFSDFTIVKNLINAKMVVTDRIGYIFKLSSYNYARKLDLLCRSHTLESWSQDFQF